MKKVNLVILVLLLTGSLLSAQSKFGIEVGGAYLAPMSDFSDVYKAGFGGLASLTYNATDNLQLSVNTGYAQFSFNNDKFNQLLDEFFGGNGTSFNVNIDSKLTIIPVMVGGKYFFTTSVFRPYVATDLGVHIISVSASKVTVAGQTMDATTSQSKAATAWGIGVGFLYKVAPKVNIDVNAKVNGDNLEVGTNFSTSGSGYSASQTSKSTATFFSVMAGVQFEL